MSSAFIITDAQELLERFVIRVFPRLRMQIYETVNALCSE
jgi:hypothetical protein